MIKTSCTHETKHKHGKDRKGNQRYKCALCGQTLVEATPKPFGELRVSPKRAAMALKLMFEGVSIRAIQRLTGICRQTLADMIVIVGRNCQRFLDAAVKNVEATDVQLDELWSFVGMKEKTRIARNRPIECGDSWTFLAIERNTKMILAHQVGQRDINTCRSLLFKLKDSTTGRFQLSTDGLSAYTLNVPFILGNRVDFAQLIKTYAATQETARYSPAAIIKTEKQRVFGNPNPDLICTSHVERLNLTYRMTLRRFTRLTNAHSKSLKHHIAVQAIFIAFYNFCRKHETLKGKTPAMASGLTDHAWSIEELLDWAAGC